MGVTAHLALAGVSVVSSALGRSPPSGHFDFVVNAYARCRPRQPSTACFDDRAFSIAWDTRNAGDHHRISAQRYWLGATTIALPLAADCGDRVALRASDTGDRMTSDAVTASDALAFIEYAVGQPIPLDCPSC